MVWSRIMAFKNTDNKKNDTMSVGQFRKKNSKNNSYFEKYDTSVDLLVVVGTRPQFIKLAVLLQEFHKQGLSYVVINTGQHYDYQMNRVFFDELQLPDPIAHLNVGSGTHGQQTALMLERLEKTYLTLKSEAVIVPGDTNSALAGALAAVKLKIHSLHIEAGLRSRMQFMAEEINRVIIDHISTFLFAPTRVAYDNLHREGIEDYKIHLTGDVMVDNICYYSNKIATATLPIDDLDDKYIFVTTHRAENVDYPERLKEIVESLIEITRTFELRIILPLHPRTRRRLEDYGLYNLISQNKNISIIEPVSYFQSLKLVKNAELVITDSGGLQKEAFVLGTPAITMREATEWTETVETGWNILTNYQKTRILGAVDQFLREKPPKINPLKFYGNGHASKKITEVITKFLGDFNK